MASVVLIVLGLVVAITIVVDTCKRSIPICPAPIDALAVLVGLLFSWDFLPRTARPCLAS